MIACTEELYNDLGRGESMFPALPKLMQILEYGLTADNSMTCTDSFLTQLITPSAFFGWKTMAGREPHFAESTVSSKQTSSAVKKLCQVQKDNSNTKKEGNAKISKD